jgi:hypothetical protein
MTLGELMGANVAVAVRLHAGMSLSTAELEKRERTQHRFSLCAPHPISARALRRWQRTASVMVNWSECKKLFNVLIVW